MEYRATMRQGSVNFDWVDDMSCETVSTTRVTDELVQNDVYVARHLAYTVLWTATSGDYVDTVINLMISRGLFTTLNASKCACVDSSLRGIYHNAVSCHSCTSVLDYMCSALR